MSHFKSYWYKPEGFTNFGDEIGHEILEKLGHTVEWSPIEDADIITTGTLLNDAIKKAKDGLIVLGAGLGGFQNGIDRFNLLAVRGKLTSACIRSKQSPVLGDLAFVAPFFYEPAQAVTHKVGVVRHYVDGNPYPFADYGISATWPPTQVVKEITSCEFIISSSLHGCIIAEAYGIPWMRAVHDKVLAGDFKFSDFGTSLGNLKETQRQLMDLLKGL